MITNCSTPLDAKIIQGLELFNRGHYFEAHEILEIVWRNERGPIRELYRGILQAGIALYHISKGNYRGAAKLLDRSLTWLNPFPDICQGINLKQLREDITLAEAELLRLGPENINRFNINRFRPIQYKTNP